MQVKAGAMEWGLVVAEHSAVSQNDSGWEGSQIKLSAKRPVLKLGFGAGGLAVLGRFFDFR